jgi:hypothetical protein
MNLPRARAAMPTGTGFESGDRRAEVGFVFPLTRLFPAFFFPLFSADPDPADRLKLASPFAAAARCLSWSSASPSKSSSESESRLPTRPRAKENGDENSHGRNPAPGVRPGDAPSAPAPVPRSTTGGVLGSGSIVRGVCVFFPETFLSRRRRRTKLDPRAPPNQFQPGDACVRLPTASLSSSSVSLSSRRSHLWEEPALPPLRRRDEKRSVSSESLSSESSTNRPSRESNPPALLRAFPFRRPFA